MIREIINTEKHSTTPHAERVKTRLVLDSHMGSRRTCTIPKSIFLRDEEECIIMNVAMLREVVRFTKVELKDLREWGMPHTMLERLTSLLQDDDLKE